jgi:hypothetical protein
MIGWAPRGGERLQRAKQLAAEALPDRETPRNRRGDAQPRPSLMTALPFRCHEHSPWLELDGTSRNGTGTVTIEKDCKSAPHHGFSDPLVATSIPVPPTQAQQYQLFTAAPGERHHTVPITSRRRGSGRVRAVPPADQMKSGRAIFSAVRCRVPSSCARVSSGSSPGSARRDLGCRRRARARGACDPPPVRRPFRPAAAADD